MKIKTVKKLNLHELIKYVWENKVFPSVWRSEESPIDGWTIQFFEGGMFRSYYDFHDYDTFTVEVEEELTEDTKIPLIVHMYIDSDGVERSENCYNQSIIECQSLAQSEEVSLTMYSASGGDLTFIWNNSHGIPKSGVLEVGV